MAATKAQIREWVQRGYDESASHVIIVCDTYDWDDYPVYVAADEDIRERVAHFRQNMPRVMEVYSMKRDLTEQLNEAVAWHYDYSEEGKVVVPEGYYRSPNDGYIYCRMCKVVLGRGHDPECPSSHKIVNPRQEEVKIRDNKRSKPVSGGDAGG